jgi:hypothetical protein
MVDYRTHLVALAGFESRLAAATFAEPSVAVDRDQQLDDVRRGPGVAVLGALLDHLLRHAASDGHELKLLQRAATLWKEGVALYTTLGESRADIEAALTAPADPVSVGRFNHATEAIRLAGLGLHTSDKLGELETLRRDVMKLAHIPAHPRQENLGLPDWGWGDVFLARRTDAFVRNAYRGARSPALRALSFGVLSGYNANVYGSTYLEQVVGGPRRSHRFRTRVASNAVGSWFGQAQPAVKSATAVANLIRFGADPSAPTLPPELESFLGDTLRETYDPNRSPPLPDLRLGYSRLVRHLELLDGFPMPPAPNMPALSFLVSLYGDPSNPPTLMFTVQAANFAAGPGQGNTQPTNYAGSGKTPTPSDSAPTTGERCGSFWMGLVYAVMFLGGGFAPCIGAWAQGNRCKLWDAIWKEFGDANKPSQDQMDALASQSQPLTADEFTAVAGVEQMNKMVGYMFELQSQLWEGLSQAQAFLAIHGLVYPDAMLHNPVYKQFLAVPAATTLPLRPEPSQARDFYRYPATPVETPPYGGSPYPTGATPNVFIGSTPPGPAAPPAAAWAAVQTWSQIARGQFDAVNLDLDGDRGFRAPCWAIAGAITSNPITIQTLAYEDM